MIPRTKLVCTIGPASSGRIDELVAAGMSVARINFAHGSPDEHARAVRAVRVAADRAGRDVAVLVDLPGPKVRLGAMDAGEVTLEAGRPFRIGPAEAGDSAGATSNHPLAADLLPDDRVLLADGAAELRVIGTRGDVLETVVERGGTIRSRAGVAVPAERLSLPALTADDREALPRLIDLAVDFVGLSFVRQASDIGALRDAFSASGARRSPQIVAKIETRPAVESAGEILQVADGIMVARGDLALEVPFEEVPLLQKRIVSAAVAAGRPVIVATQMLESMTRSPWPTRAEASDVANAALDGADAVMLSAETAIGAFPLESARAAIRILAAVDGGRESTAGAAAPRPGFGVAEDALAAALAAVEVARTHQDVEFLACYTRSGRTARMLAGLRPRVRVVAYSPDRDVRCQLALVRGVEARPIARVRGELVGRALRDEVRSRRDSPTRAVVLVATTADGDAGPNFVQIVRPDAT